MEKELVMLELEEEIYKALYGIYTNPDNEDKYGQTHVSNYSIGVMRKSLTQQSFNYLLDGKSMWGKFCTYGNGYNVYPAINLSNNFYRRGRNS